MGVKEKKKKKKRMRMILPKMKKKKDDDEEKKDAFDNDAVLKDIQFLKQQQELMLTEIKRVSTPATPMAPMSPATLPAQELVAVDGVSSSPSLSYHYLLEQARQVLAAKDAKIEAFDKRIQNANSALAQKGEES